MVSPAVFILAGAAALNRGRTYRALAFVAIFVAVSYAIMGNLKYGMNLRYATIWDFPLRALAAAQVGALAARSERRSGWIFGGLITGLCALDLWQYYRMAVAYPMYELVPLELLRAVHILK